jgi:hypothetical protein
MKSLIESILNKEYSKANDIFVESLNNIASKKLLEAKKMCAAKMSVEQLTVDDEGKFQEAGGRRIRLYHAKQKRGLAEGDVVPLGDKFETKSYNVHVGKNPNSRVVITHKETGVTRKVSGTNAKVGIFRNSENKELKDSDIEDILYGGKDKPESMKEEAKKAAIRALQEKVRVRGKDEPPKPPLSTRAQRFSAALSGKKKPTPKLVVKND